MKKPKKKAQKFLYYRIDFINCQNVEYDYTIVSDLGDVKDYLQAVESDLDDEDGASEVKITGVRMTLRKYNDFVKIMERNA